MPILLKNICSFIRRGSQCVRAYRQNNSGETKYYKCEYSRKFMDELQLTYEGPSEEEIKKNGQCIYVANHSSFLDALMYCAFFNCDVRILAKESVFSAPYIGRILTAEHHIPVCRGKKAGERNLRVREEIQKAAQEGASIFMFPEGTRTRTGKLGRFKLGAFYNAIQTGLPIVPVVIRGTYELMPKGTLKIIPGHCSMKLLDPLPFPEVSMGDEHTRAQYLADRAREAIEKALGRDSRA